MEDPSFDALLSWSMGELIEFPDIDFEVFDSVFSTRNQDLSAAEVPELLPDYQPAAQDAVETLKSLVDELSSRVTMLEDQLQTESKKRVALEEYIENLQPFLEQLSLMVQK
ncbi:hypothetical protein IFM46972_10840 [Aspergillus udagawae]|uniref:Uncharacterized protein n=1 Tax=Aspergillus udagawae TaxID=91492 RepID=A0A8H3SET9_9EURO|nr:hypothetical protein IFM46972_10840 [Aspergillus udagawae]